MSDLVVTPLMVYEPCPWGVAVVLSHDHSAAMSKITFELAATVNLSTLAPAASEKTFEAVSTLTFIAASFDVMDVSGSVAVNCPSKVSSFDLREISGIISVLM